MKLKPDTLRMMLFFIYLSMLGLVILGVAVGIKGFGELLAPTLAPVVTQ